MGSLDEARWAAVQERSAVADGVFFYAVATTGIFCRPVCSARRPLRKNVEFFATPAEAWLERDGESSAPSSTAKRVNRSTSRPPVDTVERCCTEHDRCQYVASAQAWSSDDVWLLAVSRRGVEIACSLWWLNSTAIERTVAGNSPVSPMPSWHARPGY